MIAIDSSALIAILLGEPEGPACLAAADSEAQVVISAGTLSEAMIVATGVGVRDELVRLVNRLGLEVIEVTEASARQIGEIYQRWGRGFNSANLNFGDCFAYELAERYGCPLLYIGNDFAKTDIASAL